MRIQGLVRTIERQAGSFLNAKNELIEYSYWIARIVDDVALHEVRLPRDLTEETVGLLPFTVGDEVDLPVTIEGRQIKIRAVLPQMATASK